MRLLVLLLSLLPGAALAQGLLVPVTADGPCLPIRSEHISVQVQDAVAVTTIEQRFGNPTGRTLEAHYVFPVPKGATVDGFALWVNGKRTEGEVLDANRAGAVYAEIVRRARDPGLLENVGQDLFRARIYPILPHGEQRVEIRYTGVLPVDAGVALLAQPLRRVGPPPERLSFEATIASSRPLKAIWSPTHELEVRRSGEREARVSYESRRGEAARDLELYLAAAEGDVAVSVLAHRDEGDGYFLALIAPRQAWSEAETGGKRVTLVIDTSGSMEGEKLRRAKEILGTLLDRLGAEDCFNVIRFSTGVEAVFEGPEPATRRNLRRARRFVEGLEASGGTAIDEGLARALADGARGGAGPHLVVFVTDGEPTVGETDPHRIAARVRETNRGRSRVFPFGVGVDLNAVLLDALAAEGRGAAEYARDGAELSRRLASFWDKIAYPVLTDLSLELGDAEAYDVYPRELPDLFRGGQLVVVGRYRRPAHAEVTLAGTLDGRRRTVAADVRFPKHATDHAFLPRLWATRKVGFLLEEIRRNGERRELRDEVVALGKRHGIVTPYTSYLVVEEPAPLARNDRPLPPRDPTPAPTSPWAPGLGGRAAAIPQETTRPEGSYVTTPGPHRGLAPEPRANRADEDGLADLRASGGAAGVAASKEVRRLKEAEQAADDGVRLASGRTFVHRGGVWTDTAVDRPARRLVIRALSPAHFELLALRPELKEAVALGDRVVIGLPGGAAVELVPDRGVADVEEVRRFLATR